MATRIRLRRMGSKGRPFYRVVVADQRAPRDGRFIENIGKYHPLSDPSLIEIDEERALYWLRVGAQPSNQVRNLMSKVGIWETFVKERPSAAVGVKTKTERPAKEKLSKKAQAKAAESAKARRRARRPPSRNPPRSRSPRRPSRRRSTSRPRSTRPSRARRPPSRRRPRPEVKELVEFLCRELVDDADAVRVSESFDDRGPDVQRHRRPRRARQGDRSRRPHRQGDPHGRSSRGLAPEPGRPRRLRGLTWTSRRSPSAGSPSPTASAARSPSRTAPTTPTAGCPVPSCSTRPDARTRCAPSRPHGERLLVTFEEIGDRTAAEAVAGTELLVPESWLPALPEGQWWSHQVEGFRVTTESGRALGTIAEVLPYPAQDLWRVVADDGTETLIPAVEELVVSVDIGGRSRRRAGRSRADGARRAGLEPGDLRELRRLLQHVALAVALHEPAALEVGRGSGSRSRGCRRTGSRGRRA